MKYLGLGIVANVLLLIFLFQFDNSYGCTYGCPPTLVPIRTYEQDKISRQELGDNYEKALNVIIRH